MDEQFFSDLSAVVSPLGWREAQLHNRYADGYEISYNVERMGYVAKKKII